MNIKQAKQIGEKMRKFRLEKEWTQVELAKKAGINSNYYAKLERGEKKVSHEYLTKIAKAFGVGIEDISSH